MTTTITNKYNVLLVEDNPADAERIEYLLMDDKSVDFETTTVIRMREALIQLKEKMYDLILLDISLPDGIGVENVKKLRTAAWSIPIIVITGRDDEELVKNCIEAGAQDYLVKEQINPNTSLRTIGYSLLKKKSSSVQELQKVISQYKELSTTGLNTSVTAKLSGTGSVRERHGDKFEELVNDYSDLLHLYLDQLVTAKDKPQYNMEFLATQLGDVGGGPRDLLDVHLAALDQLVIGEDASKSQAFAVEGRLLALEMMGLLVDYYRIGKRRRFI